MHRGKKNNMEMEEFWLTTFTHVNDKQIKVERKDIKK